MTEKHQIEKEQIEKKQINKFLNSFDKVRESDNKHLVINSILSVKSQIEELLNADLSNSVSILATYGLKKDGFTLSDVSKVSDTYWESVKNYYDSIDRPIELTDDFKKEWFDRKLKEREGSYKTWLKYLVSKRGREIPEYLHNWILKGVLKIGRYDSRKKKFNVRKSNTLDSFVRFDAGLLKNCVEAIKEKIIDPQKEFDDSELNAIFNQTKYPTFKTLYEYYFLKKIESFENMDPILKETKGKWIEYNRESDDAAELIKILDLYDEIEWCIDSEIALNNYLADGDTFWIYFSDVPIDHENKEWVKYGYPRICIRSNRGFIEEPPRGCLKGQDVDGYISQTDIIKSKIKEISGGSAYFDILDRLQKFNNIYDKFYLGDDLSNEDLIFILTCEDSFCGTTNSKYERVSVLKRAIKSFLIGRDFSEVDFRYKKIDLNRAQLSGANFSKAKLDRVELRGAHLEGANLSEASMYGVDLRRSILNNANLIGADLRDAKLKNASLFGANLQGANLEGADFTGANLGDVDLSDASLSEAILTGTNLSNAIVNQNTKIDLPAIYEIKTCEDGLQRIVEKYKN
tara:strand:- start:569 stop:2290 length:1722 start_codon:yes stop_codon:yes gene_type:complete